MGIYEELQARGLIAQVTDEDEIKELVNTGKATFYIGFDPTADSLHVGHFMALCLMKRLQEAGNKPIALIGGGTGYIGDPSGRSDMRSMMTPETIQHNCDCFKKQMSRFIDFTLPSTVPGRTLHGFRCVPEGQVRAVLQLSHGMVEFIDRYRPLAEYLADRGILVTGHDHLGHGASIRTKEDYGYFAEPDGNRAVLADLHAVTVLTKELYPNLPYFLLGHSMGSFYARQYLCEYGRELNGAIIMGTGFQPKALVKVAKTLCRVLAAFHGWHYRSSLVANLSFMGYNKGLEGRTTHDWLNRDQAEVDKYLAEERCTFTFTLNAYYSMFSGILRLHDPAFLARMPKELPLLFLSGDADPVGEQGKGVRRAIQSLKDAGVQNIESIFYPGARHELLVETNKLEVFGDIAAWLDKQLAKQ